MCNCVAPLKHALVAECHEWKQLFGRNVNSKYSVIMEDIFEFTEDCGKRLGRTIKDLDDIRVAMGALKDLREREIGIDRDLGPVEVGAHTKLFLSVHFDIFQVTAVHVVCCWQSR